VSGAELDPDVASALARVPPRPLEVEAARQGHLDDTALLVGPGEPVARVADIVAPGPGGELPLRLYVPDAGAARLPLVVYLHGGGWVVGTLDSYDATCRALANAAGVAVLSVDYRRAPEDRFPAALKDAWAALRWAVDHADELGADPRRVALAGDSSGGNLAAVVARRARDAGHPPIGFQLLVYPATDPSPDAPSRSRYAEGYGLTWSQMAWYWDTYLDGADPADPDAAPLRAELAGLPPALILTAECDVLRDDGERYAAALRNAGVVADVRCFPGTVHGFWRWLAATRVAHEAVEVAGAALHRALAG
jgi:acetyl esterase